MKRTKIIIILLIIVLLLPVGITFSRYVLENVKNYLMEANNFFFNSDKLVDGGIRYEINNWGGSSNIPIEFVLNNHKNNILTSDADIEYSIELEYDNTSIACSLSSNSGVIQRAEKTDEFELIITPLRPYNDGESVSVKVTATSSSPYEKKLSATFVVIVGRRGVDYEIRDSANSAYLMFNITNSLDTYKVIEAFGDYQVNHILTTNEYLELSDTNKAKCASIVVTLTFDPSVIILDTTSDVLKKATYTTTLYNGINYINSITFGVDVMTSEEIRFYKRNKSINYTYPSGGNTSIINFSVS